MNQLVCRIERNRLCTLSDGGRKAWSCSRLTGIKIRVLTHGIRKGMVSTVKSSRNRAIGSEASERIKRETLRAWIKRSVIRVQDRFDVPPREEWVYCDPYDLDLWRTLRGIDG